MLLHWGNVAMSGYSKWYCIRQRVGVLTRSWCISQKNQLGFEQILKHLIFLMVNNFSWWQERGALIIMLSQNDQDSSFLCTCSISHPSNDQKSPIVVSPINTTKNCSHKCFPCTPPPPPPPNTNGINYLDFDGVN